jgi:hypothetical protein
VPGEKGFGENDMNQQRKFLVLLALCANFAARLSAQKLLPFSVAVSTNYTFNGVARSLRSRIWGQITDRQLKTFR